MSFLALLHQAAGGSFPTGGEVEVLPSPSDPCDAVIALTGHSVVAAGGTEDWVEERVPRGGEVLFLVRPFSEEAAG